MSDLVLEHTDGIGLVAGNCGVTAGWIRVEPKKFLKVIDGEVDFGISLRTVRVNSGD
jgi:hypothetical protein